MFLATVVAKYRMLHKLVSDCDPYFTSWFWHELILILVFEYALSIEYYLKTDRQTIIMHYSVE